MIFTRLDQFAAAALTGLIQSGEQKNHEDLAREAYKIALAMSAEADRLDQIPDSGMAEPGILDEEIVALELPLRTVKKLAGLDIKRVRDLIVTTEKQIRETGLGDESVAEIVAAMHRHGLKLGT